MATVIAKNYVHGEWRDAAQQFESVNPANRNEIIGLAPDRPLPTSMMLYLQPSTPTNLGENSAG